MAALRVSLLGTLVFVLSTGLAAGPCTTVAAAAEAAAAEAAADAATELQPTGAERVVGRSMIPFSVVQDGRGDVWALGDGLMRFSEVDGELQQTGDWSIADDTAFATWHMAPARDGGVWLGGSTTGGGPSTRGEPTIRRFDGDRFTDVIEAPSGDLRELVEAPDGALWAVAGNGDQPHASVWRWGGSSWTDMQAGRTLGSLAIDEQGRAWILQGTFRGPTVRGVAVFDGTSWRTYGADDHPRLAGGDYGSLRVTPAGEVFVGTPEALLAFDGTTWKRLPEGAISGDRMIFVAPDGTLWVITMSDVFRRPPGGSFERVKGPQGGWTDISSVTALRDGALVGGGAGLHRIKDDTVSTVWSPPPVPLADPYGPGVLTTDAAIWTSDMAGVWRCPVPLDDAGCQLVAEGLPSRPAEDMASIASAPDGTLWATGSRGTARLEGDRWVAIDDAPGQRLAVAPDGTVWIVEAKGGGLTAWREDASGWVAERHPVPDWLVLVDQLDVLPDGSMMTFQGPDFPVVGRFDGTSWQKRLIRRLDGRRVDAVYAADVDTDGRLWTLWTEPAADGSSLSSHSTARLEGSEWTVFDVPVEWAHGLVAGEDGSVWLGSDDGLYRFDGDAWVPAGFQGIYVVPMAVSDDGAVWFTDGSSALYRMPTP